ncbi:hypothetical protein [Atopobium sp. oral taxon 416]|uniref:hypothetical protein n=1 Tax=Atopobium sp. oral taxon 416 TaxID=712157 RepID=UPI001BA54438|nr:hypothetical protein [Atopobium sp. oral taxon 416]QUC03431.1 hypothetical protein J4859_00155 [Atopobium sp. oral taxon 416]
MKSIVKDERFPYCAELHRALLKIDHAFDRESVVRQINPKANRTSNCSTRDFSTANL